MNFMKTFLAGLLAFVVGSFLVVFLWIFLLIGIAGSMDTPVTVPDNSILKIDFSETISDAPSTDPLEGFDFSTFTPASRLSLMNVLRAIESAKTDDRIEGIYLRMNGGGGLEGSAMMEEIRAALLDFKESGKFIVAYNEFYTQGQYYLASVADRVFLHPEGGMNWTGMSFDLMFYKGLLDKLDIRMEVFRPTVCKYKSAVEPYILTKMSDANRQQMQQLVNSMWNTVSGAVCQSRGIDPDRMRQLTDKLEVVLPEEAVEHGFVDSLIYEDGMKEIFAELGVEADDDSAFVSLGEYASQLSPALDKLNADRIAIVYADGEIVDGEGSGKIFGNTLAATIRAQREDDKVKAVVFRVNSPGGSALASDVIWREVELLKAEKPVIVSMGSYAASGGYYISCPADAIVADRLTLTGSIGVFGMFPYTADALKNKLGITLDCVSSNESSSMGVVSPLTPAERASIMRGVDKVYATFTNNVSEGRNLPIEKVLDIAGGRVWSGEDALEIGLIDGFGGLKEAIAIAADKADLGTDFRVVEAIEEVGGWKAVLASLDARVRASFDASELGTMMTEYKHVQEILSQRGITMYSPYRIEWR